MLPRFVLRTTIMYQNIYDLLVTHIYGGTLPASGALVVDMVSTFFCIFCVSVPFIIVWKFIKMVVG